MARQPLALAREAFYSRLWRGGDPLSHEWEFIDFLEALQEMPWSWRNKAQRGEVTLPLTVDAE